MFEPLASGLQRRRIFKEVFGTTKKSPFVWGLSNIQSVAVYEFIQKKHVEFLASKQFEESEWNNSGSEWELALQKVARAAYFKVESELDFKDWPELDISLEYQLNHVEYPLWRVSDGNQASDVVKNIVNRYENLVGDALDVDGWPLGRLFSNLSVLVASWCRSQKLIEFLGYQITPDVADQLEAMTTQIARLSRNNKSWLLGSMDSGIQCNAFKKAINQMWTPNNLGSPFKFASSGGSQRLPASSSLSEWAQVGVLRGGWNKKENKIGIRFDNKKLRLDLDNRRAIVRGDCTPRLFLDEKELKIDSEIGVACFHRFDKGEYLELEIEYGVATIARQVLLLADDQLLFLNDVVSSKEQGVLSYECRIPLVDDLAIVKETENNEIYLRTEDDYTLVLPLFLPEWKASKTTASLQSDNGFLMVRNAVTGVGMSTPLVFDLNKKRSVQPRTWRQLTIAELMQPVSSDVASAYRIQIGTDQWLIYRSIGESGNRTFLGQNFADDFFVGKIDLEGNVETLLEIE